MQKAESRERACQARQGKAGSAAISQIVLENGENAFPATNQPAS